MDRLDSYRRKVLESSGPVGSERIPLAAAWGRVLAVSARAARAVPAHDCSAMDGYAVRQADLAGSVELVVRSVIYAGDMPGAPLAPGEAVRIFTGAPLPDGADSVVQEESTEARGGRVLVRHGVRRGENVREAGEDVAREGEALPAGTRLGARQVALLTAVGCEEVEVRRRVRVAILSTGDEVVKGRTPDSNGTALAGLLEECGFAVTRSAVEDEAGALRAALERALAGADALVTVGGVSVGERDLVPGSLRAIGAEIRVHGVPMKPGTREEEWL
ncbi:MAG: molybdopterin molybdotransferase MoeA, partial [Deltaproteobacteria bacterium]